MEQKTRRRITSLFRTLVRVVSISAIILLIVILIRPAFDQMGVTVPSEYKVRVFIVIPVVIILFSWLITMLFWSNETVDDYDLREVFSYISSSNPGNTFDERWSANNDRLEAFLLIARSQARNSYYYACAAMTVGLLVLLAIAIFTINSESLLGAVTGGALAAISTGLSGYIGATFVRAHNTATQQLRQFFNQPVEDSRILNAERLLSLIDDPEIKADAIKLTIAAILSTNQQIETNNPDENRAS